MKTYIMVIRVWMVVGVFGDGASLEQLNCYDALMHRFIDAGVVG